MNSWFIVSVRFPHGRYHGRAEGWPPSPLRLFQAILAGARAGRWQNDDSQKCDQALSWVEGLGAPKMIIAPQAIQCQRYRLAVPNNQGDTQIAHWIKGVKPLDDLLRSIKEIKEIRPNHVGNKALRYAWSIPGKDKNQGSAAGSIVRRMFALGTGLDTVVADAMISSEPPTPMTDEMLFQISDSIEMGRTLKVPAEGTLGGLSKRYQLHLNRLQDGRLRERDFRVPYENAIYKSKGEKKTPNYLTLALRDPERDEHFAPIPVLYSLVLSTTIRKELADRLKEACLRYPEHAGFNETDVDRLVIGRGAAETDKSRRLVFLPLPSIGHDQADGAVRRLMVVVPRESPFPVEAIVRGLDGRVVELVYDGEIFGKVRLMHIDDSRLDPATRKSEKRMQKRFVPTGGATVWRTVTPVILPGYPPKSGRPDQSPEVAIRADTTRRRITFELAAKALGHAGFDPAGITITRLQTEPFRARDTRADVDWRLPRTQRTGRKWLTGRMRVHLEIMFQEPVTGPLSVGDGRFLGLGLFTAINQRASLRDDKSTGKLIFSKAADSVQAMLLSLSTASGNDHALPPVTRTLAQAELFHRALTSHATREGGFCPAITGCDAEGRPLKGPHDHAHVLPLDLDGDGHLDHVLVWASGGLDGTAQNAVRAVRRTYAKHVDDPLGVALAAAGSLNDLRLLPEEYGRRLRAVLGPEEGAREWVSLTPFVAPRYLKKSGRNTLKGQVAAELASRGLPPPAEVRVIEPGDRPEFLRHRHFVRVRRRGPKPPVDFGYSLVIRFEEPVSGPLCLGYAGHFGLGMFACVPTETPP